MAGPDKDKGGLSTVAFALVISFIAICVSIACLLYIFFLSAPYAQCSCPQKEQPHSTPEILNNGTGTAKEARGPPRNNGVRDDQDERVEKPAEERRSRKRRQTQTQTQTNSNTAFGGYLHNAILRLQQQVIVLEGR